MGILKLSSKNFHELSQQSRKLDKVVVKIFIDFFIFITFLVGNTDKRRLTNFDFLYHSLFSSDGLHNILQLKNN